MDDPMLEIEVQAERVILGVLWRLTMAQISDRGAAEKDLLAAIAGNRHPNKDAVRQQVFAIIGLGLASPPT